MNLKMKEIFKELIFNNNTIKYKNNKILQILNYQEEKQKVPLKMKLLNSKAQKEI